MKALATAIRRIRPELLKKIKLDVGVMRIKVNSIYHVDECERKAPHYRAKGYKVALEFKGGTNGNSM